MHNWERYFKCFKVEGKQEIHIFEVYDPPKPKEPSGHKKKYQDSISYCLFSKIISRTANREDLKQYRLNAEKAQGIEVDPDDVFYAPKNLWDLDHGLSRKKLYIMLGLCNENYYTYRGNYEELYYVFNGYQEPTIQNKLRFDPETFKVIDASILYNEFYEIAYDVMYDIINDIFHHIDKKGMATAIKYFEVLVDDGKSLVKATPEQTEIIIEAKTNSLTKYKCKNVWGVIKTDRYQYYIEDVSRYLKENYNIKSHKEVFNFEGICDLRDAIALYNDKFENYEQALTHTNNMVSKTIIKKLMKKHPKNRDMVIKLTDFLIVIDQGINVKSKVL